MHPQVKQRHQPQLSKSSIISWIKSILPHLATNFKIQDLGTGTIYCKLISHFFPGALNESRIIMQPKSQYESISNLKLLQNFTVQHKMNIHFDILKIAKKKFFQNWQLITLIYKLLNTHSQQNQSLNDDSQSQMNNSFVRSSMKSFENQHQNFMKEHSRQHNSHNTALREHYTSFEKPNYYSNVYPENPIMQNMYTFQGHIPTHRPELHSPSPYQQPNSFQSSLPMRTPFQNLSMRPWPSPKKGKWSVNSNIFHNSQGAIIDRVKQILLKSTHDIEKIRQIKVLLNIPISQVKVKIEQDEENLLKNLEEPRKIIQNPQSVKQNNPEPLKQQPREATKPISTENS